MSARLVRSSNSAEVSRPAESASASTCTAAVAAERGRGELLAADADRDAAVHVLADALSAGRLTSAEFDDRTSRALTARTYGELDDALRGLGGLPRARARSHPMRKAVFWVVGVICSPFVLLGSMLTAFGDTGDEIGIGIVLLVLTLRGLFALWRCAWPRSSKHEPRPPHGDRGSWRRAGAPTSGRSGRAP